MRQAGLVAGLLLLAACGQGRYVVTGTATEAARWDTMMMCRTEISAARGSYFKAGFALGAGMAGGALGEAIAGAAAGANAPGERYSDEVDRCMATRGYLARRPL